MAISLTGLSVSGKVHAGPDNPQLNDQYYNNVSLLMHCDGINGGLSFPDSGPLNKTINRAGYATNATTSTAHFKIGNASIVLNAAGYDQANYLYTTNLTNFDFPGDFTIELWIYPLSVGATWGSFIFDTRNTAAVGSGWLLNYGYSGNSNKVWFAGVSGNVATSSILSNTALTLSTWTNIAIVRASSTIKMYINGIAQTATATDSTFLIPSTFNIGRSANNASTTGIAGFIDEIRITKGIARYTSDFVPSTLPFPNQ